VRAIGESGAKLAAAEKALQALEQALQGPALVRLENAWSIRAQAARLAGQGLLPSEAETGIAELAALLDATDFHLRLPAIEQHAARLLEAIETQASALRARLAGDVDAALDELRQTGQRLGLASERVSALVAPLVALREGLDGLQAEQAAGRLARLPDIRTEVAGRLAEEKDPERQRVPVRVREVLPAVIRTPEELEPALDKLRARCRAILDEGGTVTLE
jgi:hypothetical protein